MKVENLIEKGIVSKEELLRALEIQKQNPTKKLLDILLEIGAISKEHYLECMSKELHVGFVKNLDDIRLRDIKVPVKILKQAMAIPIEIKYNYVKVAAVNPFDWNAQSLMKKYFPDKKIEFVLAFREDIEKILRKLEDREKIKTILDDIEKELQGAEFQAEEAAVMRLIKYIIESAVERKASDIHIEADEDAGEVRLRIFGTLYEFLDFSLSVFNALVSRIKTLANLDVSEKRKPQDGGFSLELNGKPFDFRVSTLPTIWGESIVIRIFDKSSVLKKLDEIGISDKILHIIKKAIYQPNGIFLVTGPTGSGKSTTLYAALNELNSTSRKIITVEDPVEYKLKGIQQVQVMPKIGMTFATALRSILRQDPDIIMVGEIRDLETLEIAIKAAMTGHLVLSTLHTNDAVSTISRMIDMGADPYMVGNSLVGIEAQRLVKTICPYCKVPHKPEDVLLESIKTLLPKGATFYTGAGCEKCNMTGFAGRTLISEAFLIDDTLESMIAHKKEKSEIMRYLKTKDYRTMFYDGLLKALKGITTLEEVYRMVKL